MTVAACGGSSPKTVDSRQLESAIAKAARAQRHQSAAVICPPAQPAIAGRHFYCAAQSGATVTPFLITVGEGGSLSYSGVSATRAPMLAMSQTELAIMAALRSKHDVPFKVVCPAQMPRQRGLEFVCAATLSSRRTVSFIVTETNSLGRVSFKAR